jgi:hypothetical protein
MGGACPWKQQQGDPKNEEARIHAKFVGKLSCNISLWWSLELTIMQMSKSFTKHHGSLSTPSHLELYVQAFCQVKKLYEVFPK